MLPVLLLFHAFEGVSTPSIDSGSPCPLNKTGAESAFSHIYRTALDSGYANPTKTERARLGPYWNRYGSNPAVLPTRSAMTHRSSTMRNFSTIAIMGAPGNMEG